MAICKLRRPQIQIDRLNQMQAELDADLASGRQPPAASRLACCETKLADLSIGFTLSDDFEQELESVQTLYLSGYFCELWPANSNRCARFRTRKASRHYLAGCSLSDRPAN